MRKPGRVLTVADASGSCLRKLRAAAGRVVLLDFVRSGSLRASVSGWPHRSESESGIP
jgi:hypothetical protein